MIAVFETDLVEFRGAAASRSGRRRIRQAPSRHGVSVPQAARARDRSFFARNREARASVGDRAVIPLYASPSASSPGQMVQSKQTIPHFYLQTSANAESDGGAATAGSRRQGARLGRLLRPRRRQGPAAVRSRLCYRFEDERLVPQGVDAVGLAVDLEDELFTLAIESPADQVRPSRSPTRSSPAWPGSAREIPRPGWRGGRT